MTTGCRHELKSDMGMVEIMLRAIIVTCIIVTKSKMTKMTSWLTRSEMFLIKVIAMHLDRLEQLKLITVGSVLNYQP